ncbi:hypothetical protein FQN52_008068 [Onygenales sp. PD_12]|nr:hypothetical protein FQN53_001696 [Emmonsiellopsis sp. PD_33]KAK2794490.1 hypothetical protein FQN52_008068 [Onygenales sp. PD_12]
MAASWNQLLRPALPTAAATAIPPFLYGTAWKKDLTADLVYQALCAGFTGIDTAAQPKHYREDLVGHGLRKALAKGKVKRQDLYVTLLSCYPLITTKYLLTSSQVQTKYTPLSSQDSVYLPYDPASSIPDQVHASIQSSLANLRPREDPGSAQDAYLDAVLLHSPLPTLEQTLAAWHVLESYVPHKIRNLGISNTRLPLLQSLVTSPSTTIKPSVVQNRFYPQSSFDVPLRAFCREHHIIYQSFWTLTANPSLVWSAEVGSLAHQVGISPQEALYSLVLGLGGTVLLNGTKNGGRMKGDLDALRRVAEWKEKYPVGWERAVERFKRKIGEVDGE